jgi:hypothetical protein
MGGLADTKSIIERLGIGLFVAFEGEHLQSTVENCFYQPRPRYQTDIAGAQRQSQADATRRRTPPHVSRDILLQGVDGQPRVPRPCCRHWQDISSAAYTSDCSDLLAMGVDLAIHGHTHETYDRMVTNQKGYGPWGRGTTWDNAQFDPNFVIEI